MKKIPTLFRRNPDDMRHVLPEVTPGCEWVLADKGVATRKYDGTCVMLDDEGDWWARREVRRDRPRPPGFVAVEADPTTGKTVGWEPVAQSPFAKFWNEARIEGANIGRKLTPGTYELCGPKINGNPEHFRRHRLVRHAEVERIGPLALTFEGLRDTCRMVLAAEGIEGIVWHHPDGRMAKLKVRDFPEETTDVTD